MCNSSTSNWNSTAILNLLLSSVWCKIYNSLYNCDLSCLIDQTLQHTSCCIEKAYWYCFIIVTDLWTLITLDLGHLYMELKQKKCSYGQMTLCCDMMRKDAILFYFSSQVVIIAWYITRRNTLSKYWWNAYYWIVIGNIPNQDSKKNRLFNMFAVTIQYQFGFYLK